MLSEELYCRSHAELVSASHETLKQVQGDGTLSVRVVFGCLLQKTVSRTFHTMTSRYALEKNAQALLEATV